ncbi:hypothetical protein JCM6882_006944 [Rhodosporidiobolus microsporus]
MSTEPIVHLPSVGTTFSSFTEFEIAACTAAKNCSYALRVFDSHSGRNLLLTCNGLGGKHMFHFSSKEPCTCHVRAHKNSDGEVEVGKMCELHSCELAQRGTHAAQLAEQDMGARIDRLRLLLGALKEKKRLEEAKGEDADGSERSAEEDNVASSPSRARLIPLRATRSSKPPSKQASQQPASPERPKSGPRHPLSKRLLEADIDALAKRGPLDLPDPQTFFSDVRSLVIHIYAFAQERKIPLNHSPTSPSRNCFICKPVSPGPRCSFEIVIRQDDEGWHVVSSISQHDAGVHKASRPSGPTPSGSGFPSPPSPAAPPTRKRIRTLDPLSQSAKKLKRKSTAPPRPSKFSSSSPSPSPSSSSDPLSPSDLSVFSAALLPSLGAQASLAAFSFLSSFDNLSLDNLTALLQLEDGTVIHFVEELKERREWSSKESLEVVQLLSGMRQGYALEAAVEE